MSTTTSNLPAADLAAQINDLHHEAQRHAGDAIYCARRCGEELLEAKRKVGHGKFATWISMNLKFGERQARRYIRLSQCWPELESQAQQNGHSVSDLSMRVALEQLSEPKTFTFEGVADDSPIPPKKAITTEQRKVAVQVREAHKAEHVVRSQDDTAQALSEADTSVAVDVVKSDYADDLKECVQNTNISEEIRALKNAITDIVAGCGQSVLDWDWMKKTHGSTDIELATATGISAKTIEYWRKTCSNDEDAERVVAAVNATLKKALRVEFDGDRQA